MSKNPVSVFPMTIIIEKYVIHYRIILLTRESKYAIKQASARSIKPKFGIPGLKIIPGFEQDYKKKIHFPR